LARRRGRPAVLHQDALRSLIREHPGESGAELAGRYEEATGRPVSRNTVIDFRRKVLGETKISDLGSAAIPADGRDERPVEPGAIQDPKPDEPTGIDAAALAIAEACEAVAPPKPEPPEPSRPRAPEVSIPHPETLPPPTSKPPIANVPALNRLLKDNPTA